MLDLLIILILVKYKQHKKKIIDAFAIQTNLIFKITLKNEVNTNNFLPKYSKIYQQLAT